MPKQGERDYLRNIGPAGVQHAVAKPFADPECGRYLVELGTILSFLPRPPARLIDLGCGTGWASVFFARAGYDVVGIDIAPDMIFHARERPEAAELSHLEFQIGDYEEMNFAAEFDCAVFFAALHHAVDEEEALWRTFQALKPGGVCVTSEPGAGHGQSPEALTAVQQYGVTEKDMPPTKIVALATAIGFRRCRIVPHPLDLALTVVNTARAPTRLRKLLEKLPFAASLLQMRRVTRFVRDLSSRSGFVIMEKP